MNDFEFTDLLEAIFRDIYKDKFEKAIDEYADAELLEIDVDFDTIIRNIAEQTYEADAYCLQLFASRLLSLIQVGESPLTGKIYKGFAKDGLWLAKVEV